MSHPKEAQYTPSNRSEILSDKASPKFIFVTINNPKEIQDQKQQTAIRRHARKDAGRKLQRRRGFEFVYEPSTVKLSVDTCDSNIDTKTDLTIPDAKSVEASRTIHNVPITQILQPRLGSMASLRPLGSGRGFNPLAPFPVRSTPRVTQLIDSCRQ
jgi:hypothetical protein